VISLDNRPIGVFDSGLGGLTALRSLSRILPGEDIIYFGDTGRVPYGGRSRETIMKYARQDIAFLRSFDIKAVLAACGTVSTNGLDEIAARSDIPVFGVVEAAAAAAAAATRSGRIGVIGTKASIKSRAYDEAILALRPDARVVKNACPLFVPLVEAGKIGDADPVLDLVAREYLEPMKEARVDTLILGCTHFPIIAGTIGRIMGPEVRLVDTGAQTALRLARCLKENDMLSEKEEGGCHRYFVSDNPDSFREAAELFLGGSLRGEVRHISVDEL